MTHEDALILSAFYGQHAQNGFVSEANHRTCGRDQTPCVSAVPFRRTALIVSFTPIVDRIYDDIVI